MMEMVVAIIQPSKLEDVKQALVAVGIQGMTIIGAKGFGVQKGRPLSFLGLHDLEGRPFAVDFLPKIRIETVVPSEKTDVIIEAIMRAARTGKIGDGKIFVLPVSRTIRIRTGEANEAALIPVEEAAAT